MVYDPAAWERGERWHESRKQQRGIRDAFKLLGDETIRNEIAGAVPSMIVTEARLDDEDDCARFQINGKEYKPIRWRTLENLPARLRKKGVIE